jgi:excisionase family DNA binding protein
MGQVGKRKLDGNNGGKEMDEFEGLMTVEEAATKLRIAQSTVYNFINRGILPAVKMGKAIRLSPHDLRLAIDKMKKRAVGLAA